MVEAVYMGLPGSATRRKVRFTYTNWRGVTEQRTVYARGIEFAATEWHPEPQWLLHARCLDWNEDRQFAMKDMADVRYE